MFWLFIIFWAIALILRPLMKGSPRPCIKGCHGCGRCAHGGGKAEVRDEKRL